MADASGALGGRQIAGTWVNRRGTAKKMVSKVGASGLGGENLACPLTITFSDGARWEFDVARGGKSAADRVVASLGG